MSSTYAVKKVQYVTTEDILKARAAHGDDFVVIDIDSIRDSKFSQYIDPYFKLANGEIVKFSEWKYKSPDGIQIASRLSEPTARRYEQLRLGFSQVDMNGVENDNMKALNIICTSIENKLQQLITTNQVTDDKKKCKTVDGKTRPVYFMSTKIDTPMQTTRFDRETSSYVDSDHPFYWINLLKKRYFGANKAPAPMKLENAYYQTEEKQDDPERPVYIHEFNTTFYNIENFFFDKKTGKQKFKLLGDYDPTTKQTKLDNTNIQTYLTKGSILIGGLSIQIAISRTKCKLDISLGRSTYVKPMAYEYENEQDSEDAALFAARFNEGASISKSNDEEEKEETIDEPDEEDF